MRRTLLVFTSVLLILVAVAFIALAGAMIADGPWPCTSNVSLVVLAIILFGASLGVVAVRNFGWQKGTSPEAWVPEITSSGPRLFAAAIAVILGIIGAITSTLSLSILSEGGWGALALFVSVPGAAVCAILCALLSYAARVPPKSRRPPPPRPPHAQVVHRR